MSDPVDLPDPTADTNPADDQPTWTIDTELDKIEYRGHPVIAVLANHDHLAGAEMRAALVRAVEQARLLPAALDVIARLRTRAWVPFLTWPTGSDYHEPLWVPVRGNGTRDLARCVQRITDDERAVLDLLGGRADG